MRDRTADPLLAKQVLSQLSYTPIFEAALTICYQFPDHILDLAFSFEFPLQDPQN